MRDVDASEHTFVIRIWLEEAAHKGRPATWRGHIRHVLEGRPQHVQTLDGIVAVLSEHLRRMGVEVHEQEPTHRND